MNVFSFLKNIFIELYLLKIRMKNLGQSQKRGHNSASISNTLYRYFKYGTKLM